MHKLVVASQNKGKIQEIRVLLSVLPLEILSPQQLDLDLAVKEDGETYKENAAKKAIAFSESIRRLNEQLLVLADDSGLEVDVLDGQPGLYSARISNQPGATDADRRAALLDQLAHHPRPWFAQFRCVVALSNHENGIHFSQGICSGEIIPEERGTHGFGFDPIFLVEGTNRTMAELTTKEKNLLSHRARAVQAIKPKLVEILNQ